MSVIEKRVVKDTGTTTIISKHSNDDGTLVSYPLLGGITSGFLATIGNVMVLNHDPVSFFGSVAAAIAVVGVGGYKFSILEDAAIDIAKKIEPLYGEKTKPRFWQYRRTFKEKRVVIANEVRHLHKPGSKVTLTMVTNRKGIFFEETVTESPKVSWDRVLDSVIKVHRLEKIDAIASATVPEHNEDGTKKPWNIKLGNILETVGLISECTKPNCARDCRHIF